MNSPPKRRWLQFSLRSLLVAITLTAIGLGVVWRLWPWWQERVLVSQLREKVLAAKTSQEAGYAYQALFPRDKRERMSRLTNDPDTGIALKAMYELLADRTRIDPKLPADQQRTFLRHLRERTGLTPPDWWSAGLLEVSPSYDQAVFPYAQKVDAEESVILTSSNLQFRMPKDQFEKIYPVKSFFDRNLALCVGSPRSYLAEIRHVGYAFELYALDSATGSTVWKSKVWSIGTDNYRFATNEFSHDAYIELQEERVVVWGTGTVGTYVEVFDAAIGRSLFRFCTGNWLAPDY